MAACEICWAAASWKARVLGGFTAERYHAELGAHPEHSTRAPGDTGNAAAYVAMGRDEEGGE